MTLVLDPAPRTSPDAGTRNVSVVEVVGPQEIDAFIEVEYSLHRGDPNWVAPLRQERRKTLDPTRNPYFRHAEAAFWIAYRGGEAVGRISAQADRLWLERHDAAGHFGLFEAIDDDEVVRALLGTAENWLHARGLRRVLGPFSLSINQESGLLVDGFDTPPMLMMGHANPYLGPRLIAAGYRKAMDLHAYLYELGQELPASATSFLDRAKQESRIVIRPLRASSYDADVAAALAIFNDAWSDNWGFVPLTPEEMTNLARQMRPLLVDRLVWFAEVDGEPAAMLIALPNVNEAIADLDGRLLPLGWLKLLWRLKLRGLTTARVPLMGVRRKFGASLVGMTLPFLLIDAVRREGIARGYDRVELSWILESNQRMRRMIESIGGRLYKTYRIFEKPLAP